MDPIEQADEFGIPVIDMYVCDGRKSCAKPSCGDLSDAGSCHHTSDLSHALYPEHGDFEIYPAVSGGSAAYVRVEAVRGR